MLWRQKIVFNFTNSFSSTSARALDTITGTPPISNLKSPLAGEARMFAPYARSSRPIWPVMSSEMPSSAAASEAPVVTASMVTSRRRVRRRSGSLRRRSSMKGSPRREDGLRAFEIGGGNQHFAIDERSRQRDRVAPARHAHGPDVDRGIAVIADQHTALLMVTARRADAAGAERHGDVGLVALDDHEGHIHRCAFIEVQIEPARGELLYGDMHHPVLV